MFYDHAYIEQSYKQLFLNSCSRPSFPLFTPETIFAHPVYRASSYFIELLLIIMGNRLCIKITDVKTLCAH